MNAEAQGCTHREHKGAPACNKLCDAGKELCPHHLLLAEVKTAEKKPPAKEAPGRTHRIPRGYEQ